MNTTLNMWLGIAFVALAIVAVVLQAWLWSYPMDPPGDPRGRSLAPRSWTNVHRAVGVLYVIIYVYLMIQMVPRLWQYQVELPARTVMHAVMGITIGVLLVAKFAIIRFFQHFGKSLPAIGLGLLTCTIILGTLSVPFAVRAHAVGADLLEGENKQRLLLILGGIDLGGHKPEDLATEPALLRGQRVLTGQCTACHDMRTILIKPRTAKGWHDVVTRMADKPSFGKPIRKDDIPYVTAYLVALSPSLQESQERLREAADKQREALKMMVGKLADGGTGPSDGTIPAPGEGEPGGGSAPPTPTPTVDLAKAKGLYEEKCSGCHKLSKVENAEGRDEAGWHKVVGEMVEEGLEVDEQEAQAIAAFLAKEKPKK